jgi:NAD(P)H-nitrite reductase large subunit
MAQNRVLIIGAGYAGLTLAQELEKDVKINLTVVDARQFLLHKWASLRTAVQGEEWIGKVIIPIKKTLKRAQVVQGRVVQVNDKEKYALLESGEKLYFDVVVVATGARNLSPGEPPSTATSLEDTMNYFLEMKSAIEEAKSIVVWGTGFVGLELCGEIRHRYPQKIITLVQQKGHQFGGHTGLLTAQLNSLRTMLHQNSVQLIDNEDVVSPVLPDHHLPNASPIVQVPNARVKLSSGRALEADLLLLALGGRLSTFEIFPNSWLSMQTGEIRINPETFQVENCKYAFSFGGKLKRLKKLW